MNNLQPWQKDLLGGMAKGDMFVISYGRRTGKSMMAARFAAFMNTRTTKYSALWGEWQETIGFVPRKSVSGKWIVGLMHKRGRTMHKMIVRGGTMKSYKVYEYATRKEIFTARLKGQE